MVKTRRKICLNFIPLEIHTMTGGRKTRMYNSMYEQKTSYEE